MRPPTTSRNDPCTQEHVTGLVLAGGQSSRMQSLDIGDKGLLSWNGKPLVQHVYERLRAQVDLIAISANRHLSQYEAVANPDNAPVWPDDRDESWETYPGPLAGIFTGLRHCTTPWLVTAPCDSPLVHPQLVQKLYAHARQKNASGALAMTPVPGHCGEIKLHPTFALLHRSLLPALGAYLQNGGRKVQCWMLQEHFVPVMFEDIDYPHCFFTNINTPSDFEAFQGLTHTI